MTRFLSDSLEAHEPFFRLQLKQLEQAHGHPAADIRLSEAVAQATRAKIRKLGLDPLDTTPEELYKALQNQLVLDEQKLQRRLQTHAATHISLSADAVAGLAQVLGQEYAKQPAFALKSVRLKSLLRSMPPKKVMKQLGYRSLESLLKHEAPALIVPAAYLLESSGWQRSFRSAYRHLKATDFEQRTVQILYPLSSRWQEVMQPLFIDSKQNVFVWKELGALVLTPLPTPAPVGVLTASVVLALQGLQELEAASLYLHYCQFRSDFGRCLQLLVSNERSLRSGLFDQPLPLELLPRSLATLTELPESFEPGQFADRVWQPVGEKLQALEPSLSFWTGGEFAAMLHNHRAVSLHVLDVALNVCNHVPFERRVIHYFQQSLWHELLLKYMQPRLLEQSLAESIRPTLAPAYALAEN